MAERGGTVRAHRVAVDENPPSGVSTDYADAFAIPIERSDTRSAEEWARVTLDDSPWPFPHLLPLGWRAILGFRLGPRPSPAHILGWRIVTSQSDAIHLHARSGLLTADLVFRVDAARAVLTTFIHYEKTTTAPVVWAVAAPIHRAVAPILLNHAAGRVRARPR
jgi:hypothetical protein